MFVFVGLRVLSQQKNPKDTELGILVVFFEPFRLSATKTTIRGNAEINCRVLKNQLECPSNFGLPRRQPPRARDAIYIALQHHRFMFSFSHACQKWFDITLGDS